MSTEDRVKALEEIHAMGGSCETHREKIWEEIARLKKDEATQNVEQAKVNTRVAMVTGFLCGLPSLLLLVLEVYRTLKG